MTRAIFATCVPFVPFSWTVGASLSSRSLFAGLLTSVLDADLQVAVKPNGGVRDELEDRHLEARCRLNLRVINCRTDVFQLKYVSMQQRGRHALLPGNQRTIINKNLQRLRFVWSAFPVQQRARQRSRCWAARIAFRMWPRQSASPSSAPFAGKRRTGSHRAVERLKRD